MFESIGLISSILIGAVTIAWSIHGVRKQMWLQSFLEFTGRYNKIATTLPTIVAPLRTAAGFCFGHQPD